MRRQSGFSLLEGLLVLLVISIGYLAIGRLQVSLWRNQLDALQQLEAVQLADSKLNSLRKQLTIAPSGNVTGNDHLTRAYTRYRRNWHSLPQTTGSQAIQTDIQWRAAVLRTFSLASHASRRQRKADGLWISKYD